MVSPYPGAHCEPCAKGAHHRCLGWIGPVWCGCTDGLCGLRLITGVMWDITEREGDDSE